MERALHIWKPDRRICTFYDRRDLGDYIRKLFPSGAWGDVIIQTDDGDGNVQTLCTVHEAVLRGREWLMCREPEIEI